MCPYMPKERKKYISDHDKKVDRNNFESELNYLIKEGISALEDYKKPNDSWTFFYPAKVCGLNVIFPSGEKYREHFAPSKDKSKEENINNYYAECWAQIIAICKSALETPDIEHAFALGCELHERRRNLKQYLYNSRRQSNTGRKKIGKVSPINKAIMRFCESLPKPNATKVAKIIRNISSNKDDSFDDFLTDLDITIEGIQESNVVYTLSGVRKSITLGTLRKKIWKHTQSKK